jgi:hypothetical protein
MAKYVKKTVSTVFLIGLLVLAVMSVVGMVYLSQMAYSSTQQSDGKYCGGLTLSQRNIARLATIVLWIQFAWIILGSFLQPIWT